MNHEAAAAELHTARLDRRPIERFTSRTASFTSDDAYAVQAAGIELRRADGERVIGAKLGFTSAAMRAAMGVASPNYGILTDAMVIDGASIDTGGLIHPKIEPEIAFVLGDDLNAPDVTAADVSAATDHVLPCLEIVDSRFAGFSFLAEDNIADNSSAAALVLGEPAATPRDLEMVVIVLEADGDVVASATGAAVHGHPAAAVAWAARALYARGTPLRTGDLVISGGATAPIDLDSVDSVRCTIDRIGAVTIRKGR